MRPLILFGEHELTIDDKNRLLVPADVRKLLNPERDGDAFFLVIGVNRKPWLYPERYYETMVAQVPSEITPGDDMLARDQMLFGMASRLEWDKQGRVLVPDKTLKRTGLGREVTLIGVRDHLELWNTADWETRREELFSRRPAGTVVGATAAVVPPAAPAPTQQAQRPHGDFGPGERRSEM